MASVNIPSTIDDPNYRYKMPAVRCKVEGSGNGVKTNHMNLREIAGALKRNPEYVTKFLACEMCVHGRYFSDEGKAIFQGVHTVDELATKLDSFIHLYVLCPGCSLPELDLFVENKTVKGKCNACGIESLMNNIHRVAAFIVKNPPTGSTMGKKTMTKEEKKLAKETKSTKETKDEPEKKKRTKIVRKKKKTTKVADTAFARISALSNTVMVRMNTVFANGQTEPSAFLSEIRSVQLTMGFSVADRMFVGLAALFNCGIPVDDASDDEQAAQTKGFNDEFNRVDISDYKPKLPYIAAIADDDAPEATFEALQFFGYHLVTDASFRAHFPLLMKALYDESIVDDDDILQFYKKETIDGDDAYNQTRKALQPLLKWLEAAAEGSSEEESSD